MSLTRYPVLPDNDVDRQGTAWLFCDVADCPREAEVLDVEEATVGGTTYRYAPMPDGWVTNNPDDNALAGAAQFCPDHGDRVVKPDPDVEPEVVEDPAPA